MIDKYLFVVTIYMHHSISLVLLASVIVYFVFVEWRIDEVSRHTLHYLTAFTLAFCYSSFLYFFPFLPHGPIVAVVIYSGILYNVSRRLYLIAKYQIKAIFRKDKQDAG